MKYQECLDYLFGLTHSGIKLGLKNTSRLLDYFNNPQLKTPTIHLSGTNGKGSTAANIESILRSAGYRVGLYTSPHLLDFRERIQINREWITEEEFVETATRVKKALEDIPLSPTFFEFGTVMAFLYFKEMKTDCNVIETGLGGRLDATNLCKAEVSVITSIGLDHDEYLGSNLKKIAWEKASIIKDKSTVVTGVEDDKLFRVIDEQAQKFQARCHRLGNDFHIETKNYPPTSRKFNYIENDFRLEGLEHSLLGTHQTSNAGLAIAACRKMSGMNVSEEAIRKGLESVQWEGRLEIISEHPTVLLDCAHNPDAFRQIQRSLKDYFTYDRCILILGIMKDKPIAEMIEIAAQFADKVILVKPQIDRCADPGDLRSRFLEYEKVVEIIEEIPYALRTAIESSSSNDIICVTGSIHTVAEAKQTFEK